MMMPTVNCGFESSPGLLVRFGPTLLVQIGYDPDFMPGSGNRPAIPADRYDAPVDTGATVTCIDIALAQRLDLPVAVPESSVAGALGPGAVPEYRAAIHIPELNATFGGNLIGVHLAVGGQRHRAIIGRDFLRRFRLVYDGPTGAVAISNDP